FFLSSRRRHTRFSRDWSSDVCSSDLKKTLLQRLLRLPSTPPSAACQPTPRRFGPPAASQRPPPCRRFGPRNSPLRHKRCVRSLRSEERRVGKVCRFLQ